MLDEVGAESASDRRAIAAVLEAVSRDFFLHSEYVLKGGLALQMVYGSPRRSDDLDFNAVRPTSNDITESTKERLLNFADRLDAALRQVAPEYNFESLVTVRQKLSTEIPTLLTDVAYTSSRHTSGRVKLQLTLSEIVCDTAYKSVDGFDIHTASLEDILAEKLKALLQQITRDKMRASDVFDVWYFTTISAVDVDAEAVTQYMLEKKKQWRSMPPLEKRQFRRKSVVQHSAQEYEELSQLLPRDAELPPFREAYECVLRFVDRLELPD